MSSVAGTHVFAVGISSYALGDSWKLPNAAEHALQFSLWAQGKGVTADRIHLFLSRPDAQRLQPRITQARLTCHDATAVELIAFSQQQLPELSGELLYMFWSGHGSMSLDGRRVLFYEDITQKTQLPFDINQFLARMRSTSAERFEQQFAFIDACANRFEELGFDASLGQMTAGTGGQVLQGVKQRFFLAADSGEQAKEGAFGSAVLAALADASRTYPAEWPVDQDRIVAAVRPKFDELQHPVLLAWTTGAGDAITEQTAGELPASRFVNAAAYSRRIPVTAVRRLAKIALDYATLRENTRVGEQQRDALYAGLFTVTGRQPAALRRSTPDIEMLHIVGTALQWNQEWKLHADLGQLVAAGEFADELRHIALIRAARDVVDHLHGATLDDIRAEYLKTVERLGREPQTQQAATIDAMLDELYQTNANGEPLRLWEFLLRLAERFPADAPAIETFIASHDVPDVALNTLKADLANEQQFVLSFNVVPTTGATPAIKELRALLVVEGTPNVKHRFDPVAITTWTSFEEKAGEIIQKARQIVMSTYRRAGDALLIEFLMPYPFLRTAAESLSLQLPRKRTPLGAEHPVIVRVRERTAEPHNALGLDKWIGFGKRINRANPGAVHWVEPAGPPLEIEACEGVLALRFFPDDDDKVLDIVDKGFAFMAWLRAEPTEQGWAEFVTTLTTWATGQPLGQLARKVRAIRETAPISHVGLTLLWDDPQQIRHSFQLDDVSVGGIR